MKNSLINPIWLYLIDLFTDLEFLFLVSGLVGFFICFIGLCYYFWIKEEWCDDESEQEMKSVAKWTKVLFVVSVVEILLVCLIPNEKTMYAMFISSYITEENVAGTVDVTTDIIDYIFEKVEELQN